MDAVVLSRLLYLVPDWRGLLSAANTVLKKHALILHEWGNGPESKDWVAIREKARSLFEHAGIGSPFHPGARTGTEVEEYLAGLGFRKQRCVPAGLGATVSLSEFPGQD